MNQDPVVHAISPDGQWALNKTDRVQNVKWGANAGLKAGVAPVDLEAGLRWEVEEVKSRNFSTALTGSKRIMRRGFNGEENTVIWTLEENGDKADGLPTFMRAAVLLRRPYDVPFTFTVKVKTDVDFVGEVKTLFGMERKDPIDPAEIDPGKFPKAARSTVKSLDPKVHNLKEMDNLDLKEVADVEIVTLLDGGELLHKEGVSK
ncbi:ankyrin-3 protein [Rutstroemia sp. NJR-2017a BBW]|nr:ankyrin-3 protein [Rutstroemia sp. NJR-2017a BBW]